MVFTNPSTTELIDEPPTQAWDWHMESLNMRGAIFRTDLKMLKKLLSYGKKNCTAGFLMSEFRFSKDIKNLRMVNTVVKQNGFELYTNENTMYGANTKGIGASQSRSTTAIILNSNWFYNTREVKYGPDGELTTLLTDIQLGEGMQTIRLTSIYGDIEPKRVWNKTIYQHLNHTVNEPHLVGGDFNHHTLFQKTCMDEMAKAVAPYSDAQTLFSTIPLPTHGLGVIDYILLSPTLLNILPVTNLLVRPHTELPLQIGVKFDHNILTLCADLRVCQPKHVPLLCRHWHKRHVQYFGKLTESLHIPDETTEHNFDSLMTDLLKLVHQTNIKFFGKMYYTSNGSAIGSDELKWLRRLAHKGGKQFFSVCKSETLTKPHNNQLYPTDEAICSHMEKNHSLCDQPLPPPLYLNSAHDTVHESDIERFTTVQDFEKIQFSLVELQTVIKCRKAKAGAVLPPFALAVAPRTHQFVLDSINQCIRDNHIFDSIKRTNLWLIFKQGDRTNTTSYRPISIPHPVYNILTRMVLPRIQEQSEQKLFSQQFGFRQGYSCTEAILVFRAQIAQLKKAAADNISGLRTVFIDISKAFDSVPHHLLFGELEKYLGYDTLHIIALLYVSGTQGHPVVNNTTEVDRMYVQTVGVRQGCPLSPLLFALYINSALCDTNTECAQTLMYLSAFADDIQITAIGPYILLDVLVQKLNQLQLKVSIPKSKFLIFTQDPSGIEDPAPQINGHSLEEVQHFKYLGCYMAANSSTMMELIWQEHARFLQHLSTLPLTAKERIKLINVVGISRVVFRSAPLLDIFPPPKQLNLRQLHSLAKQGKLDFFNRIEKLHRETVLEVQGISGHVVPKTLYSPQPQGYGLRYTWVATLGTAALAYSKAARKNGNLLHTSVLRQFQQVLFSQVKSVVGAQVLNQAPTQTLEAMGVGLPPTSTIHNVHVYSFTRKEYQSAHPTAPMVDIPSGQIYCDGSLKLGKMGGAVCTSSHIHSLRCIGLESSYRA